MMDATSYQYEQDHSRMNALIAEVARLNGELEQMNRTNDLLKGIMVNKLGGRCKITVNELLYYKGQLDQTESNEGDIILRVK